MKQLQSIDNFDDLLDFLRDELDWPIEDYAPEELSFDYDPEEVGLSGDDAAKVRTIRQLRPLEGEQPWGIFFVEFENKKLPVTVMRRILRSLVIKKRASANKAERMAWQPNDLLFITSFGVSLDRAISFAHFVENPGSGLAELRVLGWDDDDTPLHMRLVDSTLKENLRWPDDSDDEAWRSTWAKAFILRHGHVITKSDQLAKALAEVAKKLRKRLEDILRIETSEGQIRKLQKAFQDCLIHDMDDVGFADMFAQTVTYGLFSLACRRSFDEGGTAFAKEDLNHYFTSPFLRDMLGIFLGIKAQKGGLDFDEMGVSDVTDLLTSPDTHMKAILADFNKKTRGEDPVIHFYEHFLEAYEKVQRKRRGVYYTPQPVVSYIVRSVHELLQTEFDLKHGLADTTTWGEMLQHNTDLKLPPLTDEPDCEETIPPAEPFVQILDPATGTATFLVEVIEVVYRQLEAEWKKGGFLNMPEIPKEKQIGPPPKSFPDYWQVYVAASLLPRIYGYELMMAPYAIAHMKIGLKLAETGYRFGTEERARIYLTNALEPKVTQLPQIGFDALAHEAAAVNEIKWYKRFTVVIGNPPYSGHSSNDGVWATKLVKPYYSVDGKPLGEKNPKWLQDDYVKFTALGQKYVQQTGCGIHSYITNHGYIDNPTFRGMRQQLGNSNHTIGILDLHGNSTKKERSPDGNVDTNVFDIKQGAAIFVAVLLKNSQPSSASIKHAHLFGSRESKYEFLSKNSLGTTKIILAFPASPFHLFVPQDLDLRGEYESYFSIKKVMPTNVLGFQTHRDHFAVDLDNSVLLNRIAEFRGTKLSDKQVAEEWKIPDNRDWNVKDARMQLRKDANWKMWLIQCAYRPFDTRPCYFSTVAMDYPRREMLDHVANRTNLCLGLGRQGMSVQDPVWSLISVSKVPIDANIFRRGGINVFPLWLYPESGGLSFTEDRRTNFSPAFLKSLATDLKMTQNDSQSLPAGLSPEGIFHYIYAVFHSPAYRCRYAEFLKIDFPRLPLTGSLELFHELARLGGELVALHLLESSNLEEPITEFIGNSREVTKVTYTNDTVWINGGGTKKDPKPGTSGFKPVSENVWNFHIGGYQVCEKWLKDRKGRTLSEEDIAHYHKIVIALTETIRLMAEIDEVIETHGGWPGAFHTNDK